MAEPARDDGGRRLSAAKMAEIAEWASQRPAPRARSGARIQGTITAIAELVRCGDRRCEALGKGAFLAARWIGGESPVAPASARELPDPNFHEIAEEMEAAGLAAAGVQTFPTVNWCDEGRIAARGVEEWLAWVFMPAYPMPIWLIPGTPLSEVRWVLGDVGVDGPGLPGLRGPFPSRAPFAYDVADYINGA